MIAQLLKRLFHAAALALLISAFSVTHAPDVCAEAIFVFHAAGPYNPDSTASQPDAHKKEFLRLDQNGDLQIQFGKTKFTVAYNSPSDLLKPLDQPQNLQFFKDTSAINGISLKASLAF